MSSRLGLIALTLFATSCGSQDLGSNTPSDQSDVTTIAKKAQTYTGKEGGKCKVVAGTNKGKKGKYNSDGDCAGGWGITECTEQDGKDNGKCKDAKRTTQFPVGDNHVSVVTLLNDAGDPVNCTVLLPDRGNASAQCEPVAIDTIQELKSSDDELDRNVAEVVAPLLGSSGSK